MNEPAVTPEVQSVSSVKWLRFLFYLNRTIRLVQE